MKESEEERRARHERFRAMAEELGIKSSKPLATFDYTELDRYFPPSQEGSPGLDIPMGPSHPRF